MHRQTFYFWHKRLSYSQYKDPSSSVFWCWMLKMNEEVSCMLKCAWCSLSLWYLAMEKDLWRLQRYVPWKYCLLPNKAFSALYTQGSESITCLMQILVKKPTSFASRSIFGYLFFWKVLSKQEIHTRSPRKLYQLSMLMTLTLNAGEILM